MGQVADLDAVSFERPARKRRRSLVPITALIVVMALAGVRVHHWWTHPALFGTSDRSRMSVVTNPQTIWSFPLSTPPPGHADTVTFRGAPEQVWNVNTAGIAVTVNICRVGEHEYESGRIGFNNGPPQRYCTSLTPVRAGSTFRYPSPREYLLAVVRATHPGVGKLETITYNYQAGSHPWSPRGLDTQTFQVTFRVRRHQPSSPCCVQGQ